MKTLFLFLLVVLMSSAVIAQVPTKADVRAYYTHQYAKPASKGQGEVYVVFRLVKIYPSQKVTEKKEVKDLPLGTQITKVKVHIWISTHPAGSPGSTMSDGKWFTSWFYKGKDGKWASSVVSWDIDDI